MLAKLKPLSLVQPSGRSLESHQKDEAKLNHKDFKIRNSSFCKEATNGRSLKASKLIMEMGETWKATSSTRQDITQKLSM